MGYYEDRSQRAVLAWEKEAKVKEKLVDDNNRLRGLCKEAATYIDMHVEAGAFFRGDGDITVAPPFLPALRASGACYREEEEVCKE